MGEELIITNAMGDVKKFFYKDVPKCLGGGYSEDAPNKANFHGGTI